MQALRQAARTFTSQPAVTILAVVMLSLGIGASTAIFSIVNAVMLRPLPYDRSEGLVWVWARDTRRSVQQWASYPDFQDWRTQSRTLDLLTGWGSGELVLTGAAEPQRLRTALATADFFPLLGVPPLLGATVRRDGDLGEWQVVLSHALWRRQFGSDQQVPGRVLRLSDRSYTVIGVMPPSFTFPLDAQPVDLWIVLSDEQFNPALRNRRDARMFEVIGRLQPGATVEQAQAEMDVIAARLRERYPSTNADVGIRVVPAKGQVVGKFSSVLLLLLAAVGCLLLIACVNVTNLLLARAAARTREIAVRTALGASRSRVARQLLVESLPLVLLSAGFGGLLAVWVVRVTAPLIPADVPRADAIDLDLGVLGFAVLASALTGVIVSLAPLWNASRVDVAAALQRATSTASESPGARRFSNALVVAEIALAMVLLTGAGLFLNSFARLNQADPGLDPRNVLTFHLEWPSPAYPPDRAAEAFHELKTRLETVPGVRAVSVGLQLPDRGMPLLDEALPLVEVAGRSMPPAERQRTSLLRTQPEYFRTMGIPLRLGRDFGPADTVGTRPVTIVNESLARAYFPNESPIGQRLTLESWTFFGRRTVEIVGVVSDVAHRGLVSPPALLTYLPIAQYPSNVSDVVVRTDGDPLTFVSAVRATVHALDPDIPISDIQTLEGRISRSLAQDRFSVLLLGAFSGLALLLAAGGLYGVLSYAVARRTHEFGIRLVMGADVKDVLRLVLQQGMTVALSGVVIGVAGALAVTRVVGSLLFGIPPTDPLTFVAVTLLLVCVALLACWVPARRATRCDPVIALRHP